MVKGENTGGEGKLLFFVGTIAGAF